MYDSTLKGYSTMKSVRMSDDTIQITFANDDERKLMYSLFNITFVIEPLEECGMEGIAELKDTIGGNRYTDKFDCYLDKMACHPAHALVKRSRKKGVTS